VQWKEAALRESRRYRIAEDYVEARMQGQQVAGEIKPPRSLPDWLLVAAATGIFVLLAAMARAPMMSFHLWPAVLLVTATLVLLLFCGLALWRTTHFN